MRLIAAVVIAVLLAGCGGSPEDYSEQQQSEGVTTYVDEDVRRHPTGSYHGYWIEIETDEVYCIYARDDGSDLECFPWNQLSVETPS